MLNSIKHVLSVHIFIYLVVYQSKYLYPPIARLSESVNQERALRPRHPGKGLQATASSPNLQGSLQVRTCKSEPSGQGLPATVPRPGPPGQGHQARASRQGPPCHEGQGKDLIWRGPGPHTLSEKLNCAHCQASLGLLLLSFLYFLTLSRIK